MVWSRVVWRRGAGGHRKPPKGKKIANKKYDRQKSKVKISYGDNSEGVISHENEQIEPDNPIDFIYIHYISMVDNTKLYM